MGSNMGKWTAEGRNTHSSSEAMRLMSRSFRSSLHIMLRSLICMAAHEKADDKTSVPMGCMTGCTDAGSQASNALHER